MLKGEPEKMYGIYLHRSIYSKPQLSKQVYSIHLRINAYFASQGVFLSLTKNIKNSINICISNK
jgi:hypothetical protein